MKKRKKKNADFETNTNFSPDNDDEETNNEDNINSILTNNDPNFSLDNNDEEIDTKDNISQILISDDDDHGNNTNIHNGIMETQKSILFLGMYTVNVQETVKLKGSNKILDKISTTTAHKYVTRNIISTKDQRDLAQMNCINIYGKTDV